MKNMSKVKRMEELIDDMLAVDYTTEEIRRIVDALLIVRENRDPDDSRTAGW